MLKIIYAGTPEFAVPALAALLGSGHQVIAVYTQPDRPAGRGRKLQSGPVKQCAVLNNIPVYQPSTFKNPDDVKELIDLQADLMVVAAYGLILPTAVLQAPRLGCINIHASLLPRWRGAAPIQRAILAGDQETGITIMQMAEGLDTGAMLTKQSVAIQSDWSSGDLHDVLKNVGAELLLSTLEKQIDQIKPKLQDESLVTYAHKLDKPEAIIDWHKDAEVLHREVSAYSPWPVSFTHIDGQVLRVWQACLDRQAVQGLPGQVIKHSKEGLFVNCGAGVLKITELQFAGKKRVSVSQTLNARNLAGEQLG